MLKYILYISTLIIFVNAKTCHIGFTCSENECVSTKDSRRQAWEHYQCSNELHCQSAKCKYLVDKEGYEQMMKEDSATCTLHYDLTTIKKKCPTSSFDCTSNHNIDKNLDWSYENLTDCDVSGIVLKNKDLTGATMIGVKGNISKGVEPNKLPQGYVIADDDSNNTRQIVGNGANISDNSAFGDSNLGSALGATIENDFTSTKYKKDENNKIVCKPQYNSNGEECVDICKGETSTLTLILKNSQNSSIIDMRKAGLTNLTNFNGGDYQIEFSFKMNTEIHKALLKYYSSKEFATIEKGTTRAGTPFNIINTYESPKDILYFNLGSQSSEFLRDALPNVPKYENLEAMFLTPQTNALSPASNEGEVTMAYSTGRIPYEAGETLDGLNEKITEDMKNTLNHLFYQALEIEPFSSSGSKLSSNMGIKLTQSKLGSPPVVYKIKITNATHNSIKINYVNPLNAASTTLESAYQTLNVKSAAAEAVMQATKAECLQLVEDEATCTAQANAAFTQINGLSGLPINSDSSSGIPVNYEDTLNAIIAQIDVSHYKAPYEVANAKAEGTDTIYLMINELMASVPIWFDVVGGTVNRVIQDSVNIETELNTIVNTLKPDDQITGAADIMTRAGTILHMRSVWKSSLKDDTIFSITNDEPDLSLCAPCEDGSHRDANGMCTEHKTCMAGEEIILYGDSYKDNICQTCIRSYKMDNGNYKCFPFKECSPGETVSGGDSENDVVCTCLAGHFKSNGLCLPCPKGHSQNETNQQSCNACQANTYQPGTGESNCLQSSRSFVYKQS